MSNTLDNLGDIRTAVQSDLNVSSTSSLYPSDTIDSAINRAYRKIGGLFKWPSLQDALDTTTQANIEYYDAPTNWRPNSMWRLAVDNTPYGEKPDFSPQLFKDYLDWKDNDNADLTEKKWGVQWLRYFINPTPTVAGLEICVWGYKNVETMTVDGSETIFTDNMPEGNEAIALEASAILKKKGELPEDGTMFSTEAKQILIISFDKISKEGSKYEKINPMLNVPNFFPGNAGQIAPNGKFNQIV